MIRSLASSIVSLACLLACTGGQAPLAPGLVFELGFEGSRTPVAVADLASQVSPSGISFDQGVEGRAARFDGSGAELLFRGIDALHIQSAMTLELFVNPTDWTNPYKAGRGLESLVSHSDIFTVAIDPHDWQVHARLTTSASESSQKLSGGKIRPGSWHHVALVLDGASGRARLVLDGEVVGEVSAHGHIPVRSNLDLVIGTWFQKNQAFCGKLDSIRTWNRALTQDELRDRAALVGSPAGS